MKSTRESLPPANSTTSRFAYEATERPKTWTGSASSVHMIELRHGLEQLPTAPRLRSLALTRHLASHHRVQHPGAQHLVDWDGQQVAGEHRQVGELAGAGVRKWCRRQCLGAIPQAAFKVKSTCTAS